MSHFDYRHYLDSSEGWNSAG